MSADRSFAKFVKDKCCDGLYTAAEKYAEENAGALELRTPHLHSAGEVEMTDAEIQRVYVSDLPGSMVAFDVFLELEIEVHEGDYHFNECDQCRPWICVSCEGDLSLGLDDWEITGIEPYSKKNAPANSLSDAFVLHIPYERLEKTAAEFLRKYYPEALKVMPHGQPPVSVDPMELAHLSRAWKSPFR